MVVVVAVVVVVAPIVTSLFYCFEIRYDFFNFVFQMKSVIKKQKVRIKEGIEHSTKYMLRTFVLIKFLIDIFIDDFLLLKR